MNGKNRIVGHSTGVLIITQVDCSSIENVAVAKFIQFTCVSENAYFIFLSIFPL